MGNKRKYSTDRERHHAVYRAVSGMRRDAGRLAENSLYEGWPEVTIAFLYRLYDVLDDFEVQCRNLEDQGQLPL